MRAVAAGHGHADREAVDVGPRCRQAERARRPDEHLVDAGVVKETPAPDPALPATTVGQGRHPHRTTGVHRLVDRPQPRHSRHGRGDGTAGRACGCGPQRGARVAFVHHLSLARRAGRTGRDVSCVTAETATFTPSGDGAARRTDGSGPHLRVGRDESSFRGTGGVVVVTCRFALGR